MAHDVWTDAKMADTGTFVWRAHCPACPWTVEGDSWEVGEEADRHQEQAP